MFLEINLTTIQTSVAVNHSLNLILVFNQSPTILLLIDLRSNITLFHPFYYHLRFTSRPSPKLKTFKTHLNNIHVSIRDSDHCPMFSHIQLKLKSLICRLKQLIILLKSIKQIPLLKLHIYLRKFIIFLCRK